MRALAELRLRFALPCAVLPGAGTVHLVAGEDVRYLLEAPGLERWLPGLLAQLDGQRTTRELVADLARDEQRDALDILGRLLGERLLAPADAAAAHTPTRRALAVEGTGPLRAALERLTAGAVDAELPPLRVLCQAELDYAALMAFNAECLRGTAPFMWLSTAPVARAFVSPLCLPDAGPCLCCLLESFRRLSPRPEIYEALLARDAGAAPLPAAEFPAPGVAMLSELVRWKLELSAEPMPSTALYALHVLERATLEISSHRVPANPECSACGELR